MNVEALYGKNANRAEKEGRFLGLHGEFKEIFGSRETRFYSSPGRAEILGNHTDHNRGKVMVASVNCDIIACAAKADDNIITIVSEGFGKISVDLSETEPVPAEKGTSAALVRGVAKALKDRGLSFGGFDAYTRSDVFRGAGVSSSAAFEVLVAEIINDLYLGGTLTPVDKAAVSRYAENEYFGKPCGLLDQSGIAIGSLSVLDFENPDSPVIRKLPPLGDCTIVITNTGGDHAALTPHYAAIREEMHGVAGLFGKKYLREVDKAEFYAALPSLKAKISGRAILRAMHFYDENERVERAEKAVLNRDFDAFYACVNESGLSSLIRLQNCCVPSDTAQPVILAIEASREILRRGAVRVHGGGFAGSVIAIADNAEAEDYVREMEKLFGRENVFPAEIRSVGTTRVDL